MRFNIRIRANKPGSSSIIEKNYIITALSERDAIEQAKNKCKQEGLNFIEIVSCHKMN